LVVAFVKKEDCIGQTIDSPAGCIASALIQMFQNQLHELLELIMAWDRNHKELIKLNNVSPSIKLIVEYSDNPSTQSCPSAFQLVVASVPN
jgi:hypothetical protein